MKRILVLTLIVFSFFPCLYAASGEKDKKNKSKFPDEYEVYESKNWELQLFYWNRHSPERIMHGILYYKGNEFPNPETETTLNTELGQLRYILRENEKSGNSGWVPDGGMFIDAFRSQKKLYLKDFQKINIKNNQNTILTDDEKQQKLQQQEFEWKNGPIEEEQNKIENLNGYYE